jgi:hypothetical protein
MQRLLILVLALGVFCAFGCSSKPEEEASTAPAATTNDPNAPQMTGAEAIPEGAAPKVSSE